MCSSDLKSLVAEVLRDYATEPWAKEAMGKGETVAEGQGGVPYYKELGAKDALDPNRTRKRAVPQNFKLAYENGWYEAKKQSTPTKGVPNETQVQGQKAAEVTYKGSTYTKQGETWVNRDTGKVPGKMLQSYLSGKAELSGGQGPGAAASSEYGVPKTAVEQAKHIAENQLNTAIADLDNLIASGHFTDEVKAEVSKGSPADPRTVINVRLVSEARQLVKQSFEAADKMAKEAYKTGDKEASAAAFVAREKAKQALALFRERYRTWHDVGMALQRAHEELSLSSETYRNLREIKNKLPIIDQFVKDLQDKQYRKLPHDAIRYLTANLFTIGSWTMDFSTNMLRAAVELPSAVAFDTTNWALGNPSRKLLGTVEAIRRTSRNVVPGIEKWRLDPKIEQGLGTTAGGEMFGQSKNVMTDLTVAGVPLDYVLGGQVRAKRAFDNTFGRIGATAELYHQAHVAGVKAGLKGDALVNFREEFVRNPPEDAINAAIKTGNEWKFNRELSHWEEKVASNDAVKLVVDAFPRWGFQFVRWAGEMLGANPELFNKSNWKDNPAKIAEALTKAASGWGALYLFSKTVYPNIDFNSMEYVNPQTGDRTRLNNRTPMPEAAFLTAVVKGDWQKAKAALPTISAPGARWLGGEPGGILSPFFNAVSGSMKGRYTAEITAQEFAKVINDALPGKSVLGAINSILDPTVRTGIGAPYPGISQLLPARINPTTGNPLQPHQRIPLTPFELPTAGGTPIPGAIRVLNPIEKELLNHGLMLNRPRRTPILDLPAPEVPKELRRQYEELAGKHVNQKIGRAHV